MGYKANGTAPDWEFGEQVAKSKIYGFTPEIGTSADGFWPASSRIIPLCNTMIEMNRKLLRISTLYGRTTARGPSVVNTQTGALRYTFQNFGIKPGSLNVTATALSNAVTSVGGAKTYSGLAMLQSVPDSIAFTVAANTPNGTQLPFELAVNNGMSVIKDTITLTYSSECASPTGLAATNVQESGTTLTWAAAAGSSAYYLSIKPKSVSTWPGDTYTRLVPHSYHNWPESGYGLRLAGEIGLWHYVCYGFVHDYRANLLPGIGRLHYV